MEKEKLNRIELEFAEARKEIMSLRLENRKLESAITLLSKPMVMSDSEDEETESKRESADCKVSEEGEASQTTRKKRKAGAIVVALPLGEAQAKIDQLLAENHKLAAEIVELRQIVMETTIDIEPLEDSTTPKIKKQSRTLKPQPSTSGVASIFEKNKELETKLKATEERIAELEANHSSAIRSINAKQEKEIRKIKYEKKYVETLIIINAL
jgi:regulator of replication initiation timing